MHFTLNLTHIEAARILGKIMDKKSQSLGIYSAEYKVKMAEYSVFGRNQFFPFRSYTNTYVELLLYADSILCSPIFSVCLQSGRRLTFQQPTTISHKFHEIVHFDVQNIWIVSVFHPVVCTAVDVIFFDMLSTVSF